MPPLLHVTPSYVRPNFGLTRWAHPHNCVITLGSSPIYRTMLARFSYLGLSYLSSDAHGIFLTRSQLYQIIVQYPFSRVRTVL